MTGSSSNSHENENDNMKPDKPPRPKTEPSGAEGSSDTQKTKTDPATGTPHR